MADYSCVCMALVLIQVGLCIQAADNSLWQTFKSKHNKNYQAGEEQMRQLVWQQKVKLIQRHNLEYDLGLHSYSMGINEYSDLTPEEYGRYLLGAKQPKVRQSKPKGLFKRTLKDLNHTVDWRNHGYVTPIKNQGQCGSCWAFSTTGTLEGQHFKRTGHLVSLSEQNLVDCVKGNAGCNGGWMDTALLYIQTNGGIDTENQYPYEAKTETCHYKEEYKGATDYGYFDVAKGDEVALMAAVAEIGPISVAIDASHASFGQYRSGVYVEENCSNKTVDHAVLVVGYGNYYGQDYWLVKNSWGTSWGQNGYIMMSRNKDNMCGIASFATFPLA